MTDSIRQIGENFWNVRGSLKVAGILDVGTQMSLVRLEAGGFVLLDSYAADEAVKAEIFELTDGGRQVTAIINLHPFHTLHVLSTAKAFPDARLYGTRRHVRREPSLHWEATHSEDPELNGLFGKDFHFSVPRGVELIPDNELLHFSSVLALHKQSKTLHVDDTLTYANLPVIGGLRFHPSLGAVLEKRPGAAAEFRSWANELIELCKGVDYVCPAHLKTLPENRAEGGPIDERIRTALGKVESVIAKHQAKYG